MSQYCFHPASLAMIHHFFSGESSFHASGLARAPLWKLPRQLRRAGSAASGPSRFSWIVERRA